MDKINHLSIKGFGCLYDIELEMRSPKVVIGANGVGKTSRSASARIAAVFSP